jgi:hypothetical protein
MAVAVPINTAFRADAAGASERGDMRGCGAGCPAVSDGTLGSDPDPVTITRSSEPAQRAARARRRRQLPECQDVAATNDRRAVSRHDEEHLRRFVAARNRKDAGEMHRWWEELVIDFADRMDGLVALAHRGRLDGDEHELAVAMSMARFSRNLITTFSGVSIGELVNACKTLARGICMDVQRLSMRERRHEGPSLDAGWDADNEDRPAHSWETYEATHRFDRDERSAEVRDFLAWALPQIKAERRRVLELSFHGAEVSEVAAELQITKDNAYQLRSRGMKDLAKLKERYDV